MSLYSSVDLYYKPKFFLTVGTLLSFFFLFSLPVATAITWNVDFTTVTVNNTVYWDSHPFSYLDDTYYNQSEIDDIIVGNFTANLSDYVPYVGATGDVDLGSNDFWVRDGNFTRDLIVMDDFDVYDNSFFHNNADIYGTLDVFDNSYFYGDVRIQNNSRTVLEVETTNTSESAELQLNADGVNDLYIYTYGSEKTGTYYGLPKANSSYVDARGERLVVGTFDASPMYLSTDLNARFILTSAGDFIPFDDEYYDIGNSSNRIEDIYVLGEEVGGVHFVEDDGVTIGNLSMDDNLNLLWNGGVIGNHSFNASYISDSYVPYTGANQNINLGNNNFSVNSSSLFVNSYNGWVGVGTTTPSVALDIIGGTGGKTLVLNNTATGAGGSSWLITPSLTSWSASGDKLLFIPNSLSSGDAKVVITTSGNVGIGTTGPGNKINTGVYFKPDSSGTHFDIYSANNEAVLNLRSNQNANGAHIGGIYFTRDAGGSDAHRQVAAIQARQVGNEDTNDGADLYFFTKMDEGGVGVDSPRMVIKEDGNVGIGTTGPFGALHVVGSYNPFTIERNTADAQNNEWAFRITAAPFTGSILGDRALSIFPVDYDADFAIFTDKDNPTVPGLIVKSNNGNVGIGTTTPNEKLVVKDGAIKLERSVSTSDAFYTLVTGESHGRFVMKADGLLAWGPGSATRDTTLYRDSANKLRTGDSLIIDGNVGIGTTEPTLAKLQVNGSVGGISIYAENNISAEDYLYHSPFPSEYYTDAQALSDLMKIKGSNGKVNYSTMPNIVISVLNKPIYEIIINQTERIEQTLILENYTYTEEVCEYVDKGNEEYEYVCEEVIKTGTKNKQNCYNITKEKYEKIENDTKFKKVVYQEEVCENVYENKTIIENITIQNQIGMENESQISVGLLSGVIIKSVQEIFRWNTEQDSRIKMLEDELCKKDGSYSWCINEK